MLQKMDEKKNFLLSVVGFCWGVNTPPKFNIEPQNGGLQ